MGLDMYLKLALKVDSIEELEKLEDRLSVAFFAGKLEKELKKIQKEKGFKKPIQYEINDYIKTKADYDRYNKDGDRATKIELTKEVGYWRKFNALHSWFVQTFQGGVDECQRSLVDFKVLEELLYSLAKINKKNAKEILPTAAGFFFGGTGYDEYYWQDIEELKVYLITLIADNDFEEHTLIYRASW